MREGEAGTGNGSVDRRPGRGSVRLSGRLTRGGAAIPIVAALLIGGGEVAAQSASPPPELVPPTVAVTGGWFNREDFFGEGPSSLLGLRVRLPIATWLVLEPGVQYTEFRPDILGDPDLPSADLQLLLVDFQLQLQLPLDVTGPDRLRPYAGVGAGGVVDFREERSTNAFLMSTFSAAVGVEWNPIRSLALLVEGRARTLEEGGSRAFEFTAGIGWRP